MWSQSSRVHLFYFSSQRMICLVFGSHWGKYSTKTAWLKPIIAFQGLPSSKHIHNPIQSCSKNQFTNNKSHSLSSSLTSVMIAELMQQLPPFISLLFLTRWLISAWQIVETHPAAQSHWVKAANRNAYAPACVYVSFLTPPAKVTSLNKPNIILPSLEAKQWRPAGKRVRWRKLIKRSLSRCPGLHYCIKGELTKKCYITLFRPLERMQLFCKSTKPQ